MTPLQVTNKPRCKERVRNLWYHVREFGQSADGCHQCPFPIWKDGYCKRHHPKQILQVLYRQERRLAAKLSEVQSKISEAESIPVPPNFSSPENPS